MTKEITESLEEGLDLLLEGLLLRAQALTATADTEASRATLSLHRAAHLAIAANDADAQLRAARQSIERLDAAADPAGASGT